MNTLMKYQILRNGILSPTIRNHLISFDIPWVQSAVLANDCSTKEHLEEYAAELRLDLDPGNTYPTWLEKGIMLNIHCPSEWLTVLIERTPLPFQEEIPLMKLQTSEVLLHMEQRILDQPDGNWAHLLSIIIDNYNFPIERAAAYSYHESEAVRLAIAARDDCPAELYQQFATDEDENVRLEIMIKDDLNPSLQATFRKQIKTERISLRLRYGIPPYLLFDDPMWYIRREMAAIGYYDQDYWAQDKDKRVRTIGPLNLDDYKELTAAMPIDEVYHYSDDTVLSGPYTITDIMIESLVTHEDPVVREGLARNSTLGLDTWKLLLEDPATTVRDIAQQNVYALSKCIFSEPEKNQIDILTAIIRAEIEPFEAWFILGQAT